MIVFSIICILLILPPFSYLYLQLLGSMRSRPWDEIQDQKARHYFCIAIAAHNEETVIADTVQRLLKLDYPEDRFSIHIVADHCSDRTAELARQAGAAVYERNEGARNGKASALAWLFQRLLGDAKCEAVVVFDADTRVDRNFLRVMDQGLKRGEKIIQGQHIISNPDDGWFPALTWAMFLIDNRFQNLGRANLGWSAKNMGDSICFRADALRDVGWGEGLADDYQLRQKFLLQGVKIAYDPAAVGYGEAPLTWAQARAQRLRWIRGVQDANQQFAGQLLRRGLQTGDPALLDGAMQAYLPSYTFLTVGTILLFCLNLLGSLWTGISLPSWLMSLWIALIALLFLYPLIGLAFEKAPLKAFMVMLTAPLFMLWRIWLTILGRFGKGNVTWVRTAHKG